MADQLKNVIVGIFVLIALALITFIILFLHPQTGDEGQALYVRFTDVDKLNIGTRVTLAGKQIGEVVAIREIKDAREGKKDEYGHYYVYELKLLVDSGVKIYNTDLITSRTSGLLGEKSVAIIPQAPEPNQVPEQVTSKNELYATPTGSVEDTMAEFKEVADKFDRALDNISAILEDVRQRELIAKITDTVENLSEITNALNQPDELTAIIQNFENFSETLAKRTPESWDTLDSALVKFKSTMTDVSDASAKVARGEGTIGKIINDEDLYLRLTSLLNKGETVMDDINHYGILFQLDKGWQRLRARRMNLLQKLSSPQEFRNYFNDEVDQITTSLARVSMVLQKAENTCDPYPLIYDCEFSKVFAELMRRVTTMEESLKMYNQQLVDYEVQETELRPHECCYQ